MTDRKLKYDDDGWQVDRWGRRTIPHPVTGVERPYTRVSSFARTFDEMGVIPEWKAWRTLVGAQEPGARPLVDEALAATKTPARIIEMIADEFGGGKDKARRGTNRHKIIAARLDGAPLDQYTKEQRDEIDAICDLIRTIGKPIGIEVDTVCDRWEVAGRADYILQLDDGTCAVADLKTGSLHHAQHAIQLVCHAAGEYWDRPSKRRVGPVAPVSRLVIVHAPQDGSAPALHDYDITHATYLAQLAYDGKRAGKGIAPFTYAGGVA